MLRRGCFDFVDAYQQETVSAIKAAIKQAVIEVVATSESAHRISGDASLEDQLKALVTEEWTHLLKNAATTLRRLVRRVKVSYSCKIISCTSNYFCNSIVDHSLQTFSIY